MCRTPLPNHERACFVDKRIFTDEVVAALKRHLRRKRSTENRPILVFSCGGEEKSHSSRKMLQAYVECNESSCLRNVFFMKAENIAGDPSMQDFDLLTQEALVADIADWLIIFAESVGSFCELGSFAVLPHAAEITSVVVDKKRRHDSSFLMNGPVRVIEQNKSPLANVFFANLKCPMENTEFTLFVNCVREKVNEAEQGDVIRKPINLLASSVFVGSFAHELLDLLALFGPLSANEVVDLYCAIKGFKKSEIKLVSKILEADMRKPKPIRVDHVLAAMLATGMLGQIKDIEGSCLYYSKIPLDSYFMFRETSSKDFKSTRSQVLLSRRNRGRCYEKNLYQRFDRA